MLYMQILMNVRTEEAACVQISVSTRIKGICVIVHMERVSLEMDTLVEVSTQLSDSYLSPTIVQCSPQTLCFPLKWMLQICTQVLTQPMLTPSPIFQLSLKSQIPARTLEIVTLLFFLLPVCTYEGREYLFGDRVKIGCNWW